MILIFRGVDGFGNGRGGRVDLPNLTPAWFVAGKFAAGWRELSVYVEGQPDEVGWIVTRPSGRRTWWAAE